MLRKAFFYFLLLILPLTIECKLPNITPRDVTIKLDEIMKSHAKYKELNSVILKRALVNYIDELDPTKTYFIESDISQWLDPSDDFINKLLADFKRGNFSAFEQIHNEMIVAIHRRNRLDKEIDLNNLPKRVNPEEFKDMKWAKTTEELLTRLTRIKALQLESAAKLNEEVKEKSLQRMAKRQQKYEEEIENPDPVQREHRILSNILKAVSSSLDAHTAYFTPDEASQFMIMVQQRLFGIGAQLRDDLNGFSVVKVIEGGPAGLGKELKAKDRIIAVNGEPVVGMDINDVVELIRGEEGTNVVLTVIREEGDTENKKENKLDITIKRGEVVLKDTRYEVSYEPFGDGIIAYLRLYSFYQDPESSSASDLAAAIKKLKQEHTIKGLILDLRYNSGGMLAQAVDVSGLFVGKGVIVSIKDEAGNVQHLRHLENTVSWDGPLIVLVNRASASASEIVAGTLQDYGRALVVGDDHSYGKGSFQTFTLTSAKNGSVDPQGEYKVTRGMYYTVSGRTPQLTGVLSDIPVPGPLTEMDIGEKFGKYPLEPDHIPPSFEDTLDDVSALQRARVRQLYNFDLQPRLHYYDNYLQSLKKNSAERIANNKNYQTFLLEIKKQDKEADEDTTHENFGQNDLQLTEAYNIMKDLILLRQIANDTKKSDSYGAAKGG
jgi:carboxyl-terminal processing protease